MRTLFWVIAGAVASWLVASLADLAPRQVVFVIVLVVGLFLLVLMRRQDSVLASEQAGSNVEELLEMQGALSQQEAQQWLDGFLMKQQDKK